jgi:urease accessory protein
VKTRHRAAGTGLALMLALCGPSSAHAPIAGMGVFLSGAAHPFIAPALLLSLVALGLLMGQWAAGRIERARVLFGAYALALAAGLALQALGGEVDTDRLLLLCGAFAGATVAMAWMLPRSVALCLAVGVGLATGLASGPTGVQGRDLAVMLAGTVLATLALPAWVLAVVSEVRRSWLKIAVRVLGSWLAAAALLVLSLTFAPAARATANAEGGAADAGAADVGPADAGHPRRGVPQRLRGHAASHRGQGRRRRPRRQPRPARGLQPAGARVPAGGLRPRSAPAGRAAMRDWRPVLGVADFRRLAPDSPFRPSSAGRSSPSPPTVKPRLNALRVHEAAARGLQDPATSGHTISRKNAIPMTGIRVQPP